jgi:hypothetical protein
MNSLAPLTTFFGWCTVINVGLLLLATLMLVPMRSLISRIHTRMFGLDESDMSRAYVQYLSQYKIAIVIFNLVPYIALRMAG